MRIPDKVYIFSPDMKEFLDNMSVLFKINHMSQEAQWLVALSETWFYDANDFLQDCPAMVSSIGRFVMEGEMPECLRERLEKIQWNT